MILYIMRHGEAVSPGEWTGGEKTRPLNARGEKQLKAAAEEWARLKFSPKTLLTSPLTRAQQTADYVARASSSAAVAIPELAAGAKPDGFRSVFLQTQWKWPLLFVGHMPDVAIFSSRLTHQAALLETNVEAGEMLAFETGDWSAWGNGKLLWRRRIDEWKKVKEL